MPLNKLADELSLIIQANPNQVIAYQVQRMNHPDQSISHHPEEVLHIGSAFKAIVASAVCRSIEAGRFVLDDTWALIPDERLTDSIGTQDLPDGHGLTVEEALQLMIGVSDNTTTEMLMRRTDTNAIVEELNLRQTHIPPLLSDFITRALNEDATWADFSPRASMQDLTHFYNAVSQPDFFQSEAGSQQFWAIMNAEDALQSPNWGEGVMCYRKSGSLELNHFYAFALAGVIQNDHTGYTFAMASNAHADDEASALQLQQIFGQFASLLLRGLSQTLRK